MENEVILVDFYDRPTGTAEKIEAHESGQLHRAFSVFLFHDNKLLLQKRSSTKYHCPGLWTNTCCSHPQPGELTADAAVRRLKEELNISISENSVKEINSFFYRQEFSNGLTEFECDHVFVGKLPTEEKPAENPEEVDETAWWDIEALFEEMRVNPQRFTPWFLICAPMAVAAVRNGV